MTQEIRDQLIAITDNSLKGYRDRALLLFAYDSMRRRSELCACQWTDISTHPDGSGSWFLQFSKSAQEGYGKHIPLTAKTMNALQAWQDNAQLKEGKSLPQIMVAGGWKSTDIVLRYIENSNLVLHN